MFACFKWVKRFFTASEKKEIPPFCFYDVETEFQTWFTLPRNNGFSSFYCYHTKTNEFCRVRLELNRQGKYGDDGRTSVFYSNYRAIGFSSRNDLDTRPWAWCVKNTAFGSRLLYKDYLFLNSEPDEKNKYVYDSSDPRIYIHRGNPIVPQEEAVLPPGIRREHLLKLVRVAFSRKHNIRLTDRNATPNQLANKILASINLPLTP